MHRYVVAAVVIMAGLLPLGQAALAQDAAQPVYIVTYTEVAPSASSEAGRLILAYANEARKASGAVQIDALQRISDPGQFSDATRGELNEVLGVGNDAALGVNDVDFKSCHVLAVRRQVGIA